MALGGAASASAAAASAVLAGTNAANETASGRPPQETPGASEPRRASSNGARKTVAYHGAPHCAALTFETITHSYCAGQMAMEHLHEVRRQRVERLRGALEAAATHETALGEASPGRLTLFRRALAETSVPEGGPIRAAP
eukprot:TRINITY_DN38444_c0_g1_i1.p1 TRINITY_DN38444_c0_g1~~TRINITY_DN38444_c0_g1_i1.p1  ORF type:complete len:140 (+),score=19.80 TRINITY_DN38444_c0_g1_i1:106-525(+)